MKSTCLACVSDIWISLHNDPVLQHLLSDAHEAIEKHSEDRSVSVSRSHTHTLKVSCLWKRSVPSLWLLIFQRGRVIVILTPKTAQCSMWSCVRRATATHMQVKSNASECVMQPLTTLSIGFSNKDSISSRRGCVNIKTSDVKWLELKKRDHILLTRQTTGPIPMYCDPISVVDIIYSLTASFCCRINTRYAHLTDSHRYTGAAMLFKYLQLYLNTRAWGTIE